MPTVVAGALLLRQYEELILEFGIPQRDPTRAGGGEPGLFRCDPREEGSGYARVHPRRVPRDDQGLLGVADCHNHMLRTDVRRHICATCSLTLAFLNLKQTSR